MPRITDQGRKDSRIGNLLKIIKDDSFISVISHSNFYAKAELTNDNPRLMQLSIVIIVA